MSMTFPRYKHVFHRKSECVVYTMYYDKIVNTFMNALLKHYNSRFCLFYLLLFRVQRTYKT